MKRIVLLAIAALAAVLVLSTGIASAVGATASGMHAKSALRYHVQSYTFSTTAAITNATIGVCPPGGAVLRDVVLGQNAVGVGGTSWTATPKKNGTALVSTPGGFTLAAGTNKATNVARAPVVLANPTGGTRPVLDAAQVKCTGGEVISNDITLTGTYTGAVTGSVQLFLEPNW
jgi:hypothetical protein